LKAFEVYRDAVAGATRVLSVMPGELPTAIERMQGESKELRRTMSRLQESLAGREAARLLLEAPEIDGVRVLAAAVEGWDAAGLKSIASAAAAAGGVVAVLTSSSSPAFVAVARSPQVGVDAAALLRELTARFGGRGGGKPELAQGGGLTGAAPEILDAAREIVGPAIRRPWAG
jgi:alanyl-tRNA synthetase